MVVREWIIPDRILRRTIVAGVVLVITGMIVSQIMMQMGGGPRNEPLDLAHQFPDDSPELVREAAMFPDGLPPFISSGGAFQPERTVFDLSLGIGGLLMIILVLDQAFRIRAANLRYGAHPMRRLANLVQLGSGMVVGASMVMITRHPFNEDLVTHIAFAIAIFQGAIIWTGALAVARGRIDGNLEWRGIRLTNIRWALFASTLFSYQAMVWMIAEEKILVSAFFEWILAFSAEGCILTLLPSIAAYGDVRDDEDE